MSTKHYHAPIAIDPRRKRCPVCNQVAYSRSGIHPQCAMKQAEPAMPSSKRKPAQPATPIALVSTETEAGESTPA